MLYYRFGILMEKLQKKHIEQVRRWRNQEFIKVAMRFQDNIPQKDQIVWFNNLDPRTNWYFVAFRNGNPIGLFQIKNINWNKKNGESGGFVAHQKSIGSLDVGLSIMALMDFAFLVLELDKLYATYNFKFNQIVHLNQQLGFRAEKSAGGFTTATVTRDRYFHRTDDFHRAAEKLRGKQVLIKHPDAIVRQKLLSKSVEERFEQIQILK